MTHKKNVSTWITTQGQSKAAHSARNVSGKVTAQSQTQTTHSARNVSTRITAQSQSKTTHTMNLTPGTSQQTMVLDPTRSPPRKSRKGLEQTRFQAKRSASTLDNVDTTPASRPRASRRKRQVPVPPLSTPVPTPSRKRTADIQQETIESEQRTDEQRKNAFDLAVGRKKRKTTHVKQSNTVKKTKKKRKGKTKGHRIVNQYKQKNQRKSRKSHPTVQRNVAALGLPGY